MDGSQSDHSWLARNSSDSDGHSSPGWASSLQREDLDPSSFLLQSYRDLSCFLEPEIKAEILRAQHKSETQYRFDE